MRVIGKGLIGWGQRSHGIEGGVYWTRQSPKGLLLREGNASEEADTFMEPSTRMGPKEEKRDD
jgi:hypothetical protein